MQSFVWVQQQYTDRQIVDDDNSQGHKQIEMQSFAWVQEQYTVRN